MSVQTNGFKARLADGGVQFGLWTSFADALAAEISAGAGFDWLLIDAEHAPNDVRSILGQLQVIGATSASPIVRPPRHDRSLLKQYLDLGAQTLLVPMVDDAGQAADLVRAVRYPPHGIRGVASARASGWGRHTDYFEWADAQVCLVVQVETSKGLANLEAIASVAGVDAVFIGPSDLAADLGHLGGAARPDVRDVVAGALQRIVAAGKPAGVLATSREVADEYVAAGATFVGVGVDTLLLAKATADLAASYRAAPGGRR